MQEQAGSPASLRVAAVLFGPEGQGSFNESGLRGAQKAMAQGYAVDVYWMLLWRRQRVHRSWSLCVPKAMTSSLRMAAKGMVQWHCFQHATQHKLLW